MDYRTQETKSHQLSQYNRIQPIRKDYDADGRLISHTDGFGRVITYVHNIAGRTEMRIVWGIRSLNTTNAEMSCARPTRVAA